MKIQDSMDKKLNEIDNRLESKDILFRINEKKQDIQELVITVTPETE